MTDETSREKQYIGRVKWFNSKVGYGFVTVTDGEKTQTDVFVHHSQVKVATEQYRYLVQGEYVEFEWIAAGEGGEHVFQAGNVHGLNGGKLMCETRNENRYEHSNQTDEGYPSADMESRPVRNTRRPAHSTRHVNSSDGDNKDGWERVSRRSKPTYKTL
jgi:cold shock protein